MHQQCLTILSQDPEYVKRYCNDGNNPFLFGNRKWMIEQKIDKVKNSVTFFENNTTERHLS